MIGLCCEYLSVRWIHFCTAQSFGHLAKWLSIRLRTNWLWVRVPLQSLKLQILRLLWVPWQSGNYRPELCFWLRLLSNLMFHHVNYIKWVTSKIFQLSAPVSNKRLIFNAVVIKDFRFRCCSFSNPLLIWSNAVYSIHKKYLSWEKSWKNYSVHWK